MNKFSRTARSVTFAAIVGLSLGVAGPGMVAQAETVRVVETANIDFDKPGSITIYKKGLTAGETPGERAPGTPLDSTKGEGLGGVVYKIEKVNVDLKDPASWATLPKNVDEAKKRGLSPVDGQTPKTTAPGTGLARFQGLPVGMYVITEVDAPEGYVAAAPFLVSVPFTDAKGTAWNYNPVVYPKNTKTEASKKVEDADKNIGDEIKYTVKTPITKLDGSQSVTKYVITDDYDEAKVRIKTDEIALKIGEESIPKDRYEVKDERGIITITFSNFTELTKAGKEGETLEVTTVLPAEVIASGEIVNKAEVTFNNPNGGNDITTKTNEVRTFLGKVKVTKRDANEERPLSGAEFEIFRIKDSGQACSAENLDARVDLKAKDDNDQKEGSQFVTGEDGTFEVDGLHVTNIEDDTKVITKKYCLVETQAPAGYIIAEDQKYKDFTITSKKNQDVD
ncbi:hypothetical protein BHF77_11350, partial [Corynebacterium diphtheriae]